MNTQLNTRLRPASPEDAEPIADLFLAARTASMSYLPRLHTDAETRWWISNVVLVEHEVQVAEDAASGDILGFAAVGGEWLEHLYVLPAAQGNGCGTRLLRHVVEHSTGEVSLHVFQRNTDARRFYERHGFAVVSEGDGSLNEEGEPDLTYRWTARS
ncbi:MAG TPA: GNAT family N-acetyltransferase [Catenuloplanes sp.]